MTQHLCLKRLVAKRPSLSSAMASSIIGPGPPALCVRMGKQWGQSPEFGPNPAGTQKVFNSVLTSPAPRPPPPPPRGRTEQPDQGPGPKGAVSRGWRTVELQVCPCSCSPHGSSDEGRASSRMLERSGRQRRLQQQQLL